MTEDEKDEKPELHVLESQDDDLDEEDDEDDAEGVNVYTIYLRGSQVPVAAIDTRENDELVTHFGLAYKDKESLPFFAFTGDPEEGFVGMALVRIEDVAAIQSVVTPEELEEYLARDDGEDEEDGFEESAAEKAKREAEEKRERRRQRKEQEAAAAAGKVKPGNRGPKGGKGLKEIV